MGTNLHAYGKTFLTEWPDETTDLFILYYIGKYTPSKPNGEDPKLTSPPASISGVLNSIRDAADVTKYVPYLPYITDKPKSTVSTPPASAQNVPVPTRSVPASSGADTMAMAPQYQPPRPRAAFSIFVDFPNCFMKFLEAMMDDDGFPTRDQKDVNDICTTLFEVYLHQAKNGKNEERAMWEEKAKTLLTDRKVKHSLS